ncbi:MAG: 5-dehydro-2-deoxygluconokinase [Acidimicrobiales bacterium]
MIDLITVGRVSVDLYPEQSGPMTEVQSFRKSVGGTATNVAVAAARLGHHAALITIVGDDQFGEGIRHALSTKFGVDCSFISTHPLLPTPLAFAELDPIEDPNLIFYRYPSAPDMELSDADFAAVPIEDAPIFWVPASRFSVEPSRSSVSNALARREGRTHTVLDLDWRPQFWDSESAARATIEPLISQFTIAIGNRQECLVAVGTSNPNDAADRLLGHGLEAAIIKLGADGVMVALPDGTRQTIPPFPVKVVCGLGAGDAFGGAFCHGLLNNWDLTRTVRYGNAAGAIVASRLMCADDMPTTQDIEELLTKWQS